MARPYAQETSDGGRWQLRQIERPDAIDPGQRPEPGRRHTPANGFVDDHVSISMCLRLAERHYAYSFPCTSTSPRSGLYT